MKVIAIIPARYASTRFPGKPLALIHGKPMVQHVFERCNEVFQTVFVATDDERIQQKVTGFGGNVVLTSPNHASGTDRCAEAAQKLSATIGFDIVVNVQGDEPYVQKDQLELILNCFSDNTTNIATLISPIKNTENLLDRNKVKVVRSKSGSALYFSRLPIPFQREVNEPEWLKNHEYFMHLGLYAYRKNTLFELTKLKESALEKAEKLEQLRWLENGYTIKTAITPEANIGIDTPEDLERLLKF